MASPKHLWSGDWERESNDRTPPPVEAQPPGYVVAPQPQPEPELVDEEPRSSRRPLIIGGAVVAVLVIVGVVLAFSLGSSKSNPQNQASVTPTTPSSPNSGGNGLTQTVPQSTTPGQQTTPQQTQTAPANVPAGPTYEWLGMQINATGEGVTVGSINAGSVADTAGVNPGDVIVAVNTSQITSVANLQSAAKSIKIGQQFQLIVDRGSTPVTIAATLTGRPTKQ